MLHGNRTEYDIVKRIVPFIDTSDQICTQVFFVRLQKSR